MTEENSALKKLKGDMNLTFDSEHGRRILYYIMHELCGYDLPNVTMNNNGELTTNSMVFNEAKRLVWLNMRHLLEPELLKAVEVDGKKMLAYERPEIDSEKKEHPYKTYRSK